MTSKFNTAPVSSFEDPRVRVVYEMLVDAILDSRNIAMYNCVKARIPECGEFAKIAQNLDWLCDTLHIEKDDDQRSTD